VGFAGDAVRLPPERVSIGIRHFSVPMIILILLLAPLPAARAAAGLILRRAAAASRRVGHDGLFTAVRAFPL
jgi:hypothetical protein